ncbi:MAG: HPr family phosphocarrier protein [Lachnospiraceae bacterium]|jgi:catabolite repression HPr-like protein|nr:HPr family phosphocarrier protein [Lachnospiraceae bacterium]
MISKEMVVELSGGMEPRPVAMLVQVASQYDSSIYIQVGNKKVNAKSIMGMMSLGLDAGDKVMVSCDGADESEASADIERYLKEGK